MKGPRVLHPFLIAVFPVLFLYAQNTDEVRPTVMVIPLAIVLGFTLIAYFLLSTWFLPRIKAGLLVSAFLIFLFLCGPLVGKANRAFRTNSLVDWKGFHGTWIVGGIWSLVFLITGLYLWRSRRDFCSLNKFLNALGAFLLCGSLVSIVLPGIQSRAGVDMARLHAADFPAGNEVPAASAPDIYYVILDGYARADVLKRVFGYDNRSFLNSLADRGFFVAGGSRSNYIQTSLSLSSSLNADYLQDLPLKVDPESQYLQPLWKLINHGRVVTFLKRHGYRTISFSSGFPMTDLAMADVFLTAGTGINEFETVLLESSFRPVRFMLSYLPLPGLGYFDPYASKRKRILYTLGKAPELATLKGPKFVFVHVLVPHPPFVFGPNGEPRDPHRHYSIVDGDQFIADASAQEYARGYLEQLEFTNKIVLRMLDRLLAASPRPPVIILQGDHGSGLGLKWEDPEGSDLPERLSILNAYHFPGGNGQLYAGITPVNTFRVVFNRYFGTDLKLLPDRSYFSTWSHPYEFIDVTSKTAPPGEEVSPLPGQKESAGN